MKTVLFAFSLFVSMNAYSFSLQPEPNVPGKIGDAVNCDKPWSSGWADCWCWDHMDTEWGQCNVYCPQVGCDRKVSPLKPDDNQ